jgi:indolepyruvate ferredoxin oxidoreductase
MLRVLARGRVLRGSVLDPFGWMRERRMERMLRDRYFALVDEIVVDLDGTNFEAAVALASYPDEIRGYGPVKDKSVKRAEASVAALRAQFSEGSSDGLTNAA